VSHLQDAWRDYLNMACDKLPNCTLGRLQKADSGAGVVEVKHTLARIPLGRSRQEAGNAVQFEYIAKTRRIG